MIIRFKKSDNKKSSSARVFHNIERLEWIADAKGGRTLDEIVKHKEHYQNLAADLNYDLHNHRIYIEIEDRKP